MLRQGIASTRIHAVSSCLVEVQLHDRRWLLLAADAAPAPAAARTSPAVAAVAEWVGFECHWGTLTGVQLEP